MEFNLADQYKPIAEVTQAALISNNNELTTNGVCKKFIHGKCNRTDCPHPHNRSKIKACDKYKVNRKCEYGDKCNFAHEEEICKYFKKDSCDKGQHCPYKHVYQSCPNFDMGFCFWGLECEFKHISRKLCWDYMYGFCEKGGKCSDYHPKIFDEKDFEFTKEMCSRNVRTFMRFTCNECGIIGHKVSNCPKRVYL